MRPARVYTSLMATDDNSPLFEIPEEGELTEEDTQQLKIYKEAIQQEFLDSTASGSQRKTAKETKEAINTLIPEALEGLRRLIKFADRDSTKLRACTWVLENALSLKGIANTDDPLVALVEELSEHSSSEVEAKE